MSTRRSRQPAQRQSSKSQQSGQETATKLASVATHPTARKPARKSAPRSLRSAVNGDERDVLVVLRSKLAARIDAGAVAAHAFGELVREFRKIDEKIRSIDAAAAAATAEQDEDDDEDEDEDTTFDPASL